MAIEYVTGGGFSDFFFRKYEIEAKHDKRNLKTDCIETFRVKKL